MSENAFDDLIDEAVDHLIDDDISKGAEALVEVAHYWARAGNTHESFLDLRKYIIDQAKARTDSLFIDEKLKIAERKAEGERNGRTGTIIH